MAQLGGSEELAHVRKVVLLSVIYCKYVQGIISRLRKSHFQPPMKDKCKQAVPADYPSTVSSLHTKGAKTGHSEVRQSTTTVPHVPKTKGIVHSQMSHIKLLGLQDEAESTTLPRKQSHSVHYRQPGNSAKMNDFVCIPQDVSPSCAQACCVS